MALSRTGVRQQERPETRTVRYQPPPQPVLVLHEQQLDVLHELQLEHEQLELHQPMAAASSPRSVISSISNVADSRT